MKDIQSALKYFSHWELLQTENKECPECGQKSPREKRTRISKWPRQLIIHLKRFQFEKGRFIKLNEGFKFQEKLKIETKKEKVQEKEADSLNFKLDGVVCHAGSVEYGHYVSLVRKGGCIGSSIDQNTELSNVSQCNFRKVSSSKQESHTKEDKQQNNWILYNDDDVSFYNDCYIPKDCFGDFTNEEEYSYEQFKGISKKTVNRVEKIKELSQGKEVLLRDLGVSKIKRNVETDKNTSEKALSSGKMKGMNAYMIFYSLENEEENEDTTFNEIMEETCQSEFGVKIQKDLDSELIFESRVNVLSERLGKEFVNDLVNTALSNVLQESSESNMDVLFNSCKFAANSLLDFHYLTMDTSNECFNSQADLVLQFLKPERISDKKQRFIDKKMEVELSTEQIEGFVSRLSVYILNKFVDSVKSSGSSNEHLLSKLISSVEDLYSSNGTFSQQASMKVGSILNLSQLKWTAQIVIQCVDNLVASFETLSWMEKKVLIEFGKICMKMLSMYQINATAMLVILKRMFQCQEVVFMLSRNGMQALVVSLLPQMFEDISQNQLFGWTKFRRFYKNLSQDPDSPTSIIQFLNKDLPTDPRKNKSKHLKP
jgi:hypothetical protein